MKLTTYMSVPPFESQIAFCLVRTSFGCLPQSYVLFFKESCVCVCVYTQVPVEARIGDGVLWSWSYVHFCVIQYECWDLNSCLCG